MGKKGAKRKTRWRSFSIGAPPGEEDEEDDVHNRYQTENCNASTGDERNTHGGYLSYKRNRLYNNTSDTYGYGAMYNDRSKTSQSKNDENSSKPKIVFNEEEYLRITTPRQDVLFKKGYLSRKKPLTSTASTSATSATTTPSTNESQSAAHSTADGSETAEDQQLLDGSNGEYAGVPDGAAQFTYGGFYDQVTGYYYEYPVMLVGPPVPGHPGPTMLAAMSCGPVPLRPVEWFNPQYMPEEQNPTPHVTDSQAGSSRSSESMEEVGGSGAPANTELVLERENWDEELPDETVTPVIDEQMTETAQPIPMIPTLVPHMHMPPQHYVYPGQFMFGPPMVNVNGITIQNIAGIPSEPLWAKRRKKKKRRKQRRPVTIGNTEDEEEEYSSEWETGSNFSQLAGPESTPPIIIAQTSPPLNPEVEEFQFRPTVLPSTTEAPALAEENIDSVSLLSSVDHEHANCTEQKHENKNASVPNESDGTLSNVTDASIKDKSDETTLKNGFLEPTSDTNINSKPTLDISDVTTNEFENDVPTNVVKDVKIVTNGVAVILNTARSENNKEGALPNGYVISNKDDEPLFNSSVIQECAPLKNIKPESNGNPLGNIASDEVPSNDHVSVETVEKATKSEESLGDEKSVLKNHVDLINGHVSSNDSCESTSRRESLFEKCEESNGNGNTNCAQLANETSDKKIGVKNVKKAKDKGMETRKSPRNKREARNSRRANATAVNDTVGESSRDAERSVSSDTRQLVDSQSAASEIISIKPSSRPVSPEINQITTPINTETHGLPESYESLVTRSPPPSVILPSTSTGAPTAPPRRKYSAKGLKFVREPTPGPDLDTDVKSDTEDPTKVEENLQSQPSTVTAVRAMTAEQNITDSTISTIVDQHNLDRERVDVPTATSLEEDLQTFNVISGESKLDSIETTDLVEDSRFDARVSIDLPKLDSDLKSMPRDSTHCNEDSDSNEGLNQPDVTDEIHTNFNMDKSVTSSNVHSNGNHIVANPENAEEQAAKLSDHPITDAVTAWLRRANSPEVFKLPISVTDTNDSDLTESETDEDDIDKEPPKNLQSNPMLALSVSNKRFDVKMKIKSNVVASGKITKTDASTKTLTVKKKERDIAESLKNMSSMSKDGRCMIEILKSVRLCDFTNKTSTAGMRVAESSRMDLYRVKKKERRCNKCSKNNSVENIEMKIRKNVRDDEQLTENGTGAIENVKTYECGEIVVSLTGKLLTGIVGEPTCLEESELQGEEILQKGIQTTLGGSIARDEQLTSQKANESITIGENSYYDTTIGSRVNSFGSIEELDVMECWETEIIEPVVTSTNSPGMIRLLASGKVHEGEANEEENYERHVNHEDTTYKEHVQKYYRLARENTSIEENLSDEVVKKMNSNNSNSNLNSPKRTAPNSPERMIECLCSEEIPFIVPLVESSPKKSDKKVKGENKSEIIDEAFEVYESCYTGNTRSPPLPLLNVEGSKGLYQNSEGPIPCKAVCCNIQ